jgi:signal transduction histidine kinase
MGTEENKIYIAILIAVAVLSIILVYFIITILRQQKSNFALYKSKAEAEIITLEKERSRVARDLHDDLSPVLLAVKYNISSFALHEPEDLEVQHKTNGALDSMINRVREIANDLMPEALLRKGLVTALEESSDNVFAKTGLRVRFRHENIPPLPLDKAINIYRIIQELIHNTVKHAAASTLSIELKMTGRMLLLITKDDGCGFDYHSGQRDFAGIGIRSLLSRTDILKGAMYLDSKAGSGTRYTFEIPV